MKKGFILFCIITTLLFGNNSFTIEPNEDNFFINSKQILEGKNKQLYIFDRSNGFISVFDNQGKYLFRFAGKGQGPGEFLRSDGASFNFNIDKTNLYFTEFFNGNKRITSMNLDGSLLKTNKLNDDFKYGLLRTIPLYNGNYLAEANSMYSSKKDGNRYLLSLPYHLLIMDSTGTITNKLLTKNNVSRISKYQYGADLPIPFTPNFLWTYLKKDKIIYFADGKKNELSLYNLNGEEVRKIKLPFIKKKLVSKEDLKSWKKNYIKYADKEWFSKFGSVLRKYNKSIYKYKPCILELQSTPNGIIIVASVDNTNRDKILYWILDKQGNILNQFTLNGYDFNIFENYIIYKSYDDENGVIVHCFKRSKNEINDISDFMKENKL